MQSTVEDEALGAIEDAELARRIMAASAGTDTRAESELCRRLAPRVRLYGLKHLRDAAATHDLVQDVLLMTLQRLRAGTIREPGRLASFVLGTCRQMIIDRKRGEQRRERILSAYPLEVQAGDEAAREPLDIARLRDCLARLSERERTVVLMSFHDELAAAEVGRELGLSSANVRVIRHRSLERLRHCVAPPDNDKEGSPR